MRKRRSIKEEIERREKIIKNAIEEQEGRIDRKLLERIGREYVKIQELKDRLLAEKMQEQVSELNKVMLELKDGEKKVVGFPLESEQDTVEVSREGEIITVKGKNLKWRFKKAVLEGKTIFEPA